MYARVSVKIDSVSSPKASNSCIICVKFFMKVIWVISVSETKAGGVHHSLLQLYRTCWAGCSQGALHTIE